MMDPKNPKIEFCGATFSYGQDLEATRKQKQCPGRDSSKSGWDCQLQGMSATGDSAGELRPQEHCVTQLKLYIVEKLSSTILCCLSVCVSGIGSTRQIATFLQYIQACKPFADPVPPNTKQCQLILTKYQPVLSYTDPVPSSTTYNSPSRKAHFNQLNNFSFLRFIWRVTHSILGLVTRLHPFTLFYKVEARSIK